MHTHFRLGLCLPFLLLTACNTGKGLPKSGLDADYAALEGTQLQLDASANPLFDLNSYSWRQLSGPSMEITNTDNATLNLSLPEVNADTTAEFEVTITSRHGKHVADTTLVHIFNRVELDADISSLDDRTLEVSLHNPGTHDASTVYRWSLSEKDLPQGESQSGEMLSLIANGESAQVVIPVIDSNKSAKISVVATNGYGVSSMATARLHLIKDHADQVSAASDLLASLQAQAGAISLIPGETGDQGPVGIKGEVGENGAPATKWTSADADAWLQRIKDAPDYSDRMTYTPEEYRDFFANTLDNYQRFINEVSTLLEKIEVERN
jgi:hypothetical protein